MRSTLAGEVAFQGVSASAPQRLRRPRPGDNDSDCHSCRTHTYRRGVPKNAITPNDGAEVPAIGLGVFQTPPDVMSVAVEEALTSPTAT